MQYLKKEVRFGVDFLHADKHKSVLQIDTVIFDGVGQSFPNLPNSKLAMSLQYLKKEIRDEVEFWPADKLQSFLQVDLKTLGIRASYKIILSLLTGMIRSSHQRCPATSLKKRLWRRCFPVNFAKVLRTPFSQNTSGRLLLHDQAFS